MDMFFATALVVLLFVALAAGLWVGMALLAVGLVAEA
jgi:general stress protein CsbA